ncbi:MAG: hypothetical protein ACLUIQ_03035 [Dialister invisus]
MREALSADVHTHEEAERVLSDFLLRQMGHAARKVAIAHEFVAGGSASDSERPLSIGGTDLISADVFAPYNYTALGHLHGPQKAGKGKCPLQRKSFEIFFQRSHPEKGVIVGEIDGAGQVKTTFISLSARHDVRVIKVF